MIDVRERMTDEQSKADKLFEEALGLIIRFQENPKNPIANELIARWRARGPDHEAAWAEVAEIHGMAGKIVDDQQRAERAKNAVSRRNVILGGLGGLAVAGTGALIGPDLLLRARADHITSTAELRRIDLADGSVVVLGPDSAIETQLTPAMHAVELLSGMAFFEVFPDSARPFRVTVDEMTITVLGTAFDIGRDADALTVSVKHGVVEAAMPASQLSQGARLSMGDWLTLDRRTLHVERGTRETSMIAAWREGMLVAERETVASVVARIARWQPGRVVIADPRVGKLRISGVFDLRNPLAALEAVVHLHGGAVRQVSPWLTIISPI